jgi:uncharacterized repeat protein (TIGR01451 family)
VVNTVEVSATGAESDTAVSDEASCETDVITGPAIRLEKGGPDFAHVGDTITYQFAVTNLGTVELFDVDLTDDRCDGTVTPGTDVDASLGVGEVWHFSCTHVVTGDDPDPLENTASVRGDTQAGAGGEEVTDTATHQVDILHAVIMIEKTASPETAAVGATVTYTFVVSNPSADTDLFDVAVTDDRLGAIGIIPILAAGTSETFTVTSEMGTEPVTNIGTASGEDLLGAIVTDTDTATVTPIAGSGGGGNGGGGGAVGGVGGNVGGNVSGAGGGAGAGTAFTGSDTFVWLVIAAVLAAVGLLTLAATRRRKAEGEA